MCHRLSDVVELKLEVSPTSTWSAPESLKNQMCAAHKWSQKTETVWNHFWSGINLTIIVHTNVDFTTMKCSSQPLSMRNVLEEGDVSVPNRKWHCSPKVKITGGYRSPLTCNPVNLKDYKWHETPSYDFTGNIRIFFLEILRLYSQIFHILRNAKVKEKS